MAGFDSPGRLPFNRGLIEDPVAQGVDELG
jgi:hypothetical protein